MLLTIEGEKLDEELINKPEGIIFVVFSAPFSGASRMLDEVIEELAGDFGSDVDFYRIDADAEPDFAADKGIYVVPTVLIYSDSELIYHRKGLQGKFLLKDVLKDAILTSSNS